MTSSIEAYKQRGTEILESLDSISSKVQKETSNIRVEVEETNTELKEALFRLFNEDIKYVTTEMYMKCLDIARLAGEAKASEVIG